MAVNIMEMGPGLFTIGETASLKSLSSQVTALKLVPKVDQGDEIKVLSGESVPGDRSESFTLEGTMLQDLGAASGITEWLFMNRGKAMPFTFTPRTGTGSKSITGKLVVEATEIGGDVGTKAQADFAFAVVGAPTIGAGV